MKSNRLRETDKPHRLLGAACLVVRGGILISAVLFFVFDLFKIDIFADRVVEYLFLSSLSLRLVL